MEEPIFDELQKYKGIDLKKGEIYVYADLIFNKIIRKKELELISSFIYSSKPRLSLDYGCGAGWLSLFLSKKDLSVIGIDINPFLVKHAKKLCPQVDFIVCDASLLPFRSAVLDCVIGIAILHHLNLKRSCKELRRVLHKNSKFLFMEPNILNPFTAIGRKLFPMHTHTKGEKPFLPKQLEASLKKFGFTVTETNYLFFITFPLARLFKMVEIKLSLIIVKIISLLEKIFESLPVIRRINSTIVFKGEISR